MTRLKGVALLGVLLGSIGTTYGSILEAQCRARCYTSLHISRGESYRISCSNSTNCSSCVLPCATQYKTLALCKAKCVSATELSWCHGSCEFLKLTYSQKRGNCPLPEDISGFGKACAETCSNDSQCNGIQKCCYNGCGHTCLEPIINRGELPPKPRNSPTVTENDDGQSVTIRWELRRHDPDPGGVVLYVVQGRNNTGYHPSTSRMGDWKDLAITDEMEYLAELNVGKYYRIQVATVNENGSLGFCKPTLPFRLSRTPGVPSPPLNLREGQSTDFNGFINLRVMWDPPKNSDLQVTRYRVFYSERVSRALPDHVWIEEKSHNVQGDQHEVTLEGLHPNTRYYIQVLAIAQWGDARKRSERTSIYIRTIDLTPPRDSPPILTRVEQPSLSEEAPGVVREIVPDDPYWEDRKLKCRISWLKPKGFERTVNRFIIHWQPMGCANDHINSSLTATTHNLNFNIYDLMFDCQYRVSIVAVSDSIQTSPEATVRFYTPPCNELRVKGREKPDCPTPLPDIPSPPENVTYFFMLLHNSITARFTWDPPHFSLYPVIGYRIMWAEHRTFEDRLFGEGFPLLAKVENLILPATRRWHAIGDMKSGTRYRVQIQALTNTSGGAMATEDIKTPRIQDNTPRSTPAPSSVSVSPTEDAASTPKPTDQMEVGAGHSGTTSWHAASRTSQGLMLVACCLLYLTLR
ncbi:anosmin-1-like isoform X2 [Acanthaster planci]|uniref:Anosmin-1-like isoform X2 n=1 Tax=Acanthaster planci TaxID=133434 RepID=A0A8B7YPI5_ACAPL|nr:anosmin-1-like isoform X2 [Acanthaster planci]